MNVKIINNVALAVIIIVGIPTANALLQIIGLQDMKYGTQLFRTPIIQALGWMLIGVSVTLMALNKSKKTK